MDKQQLIDATSLKILFEHEYRHNKQFKQSSAYKAWQGAIQLLYDQPAIDPETMPIVRQLREELAKVTAERDAAVADLKTICDCDYCANDCTNIKEDCCEFCGVEGCLCRGCISGVNWTWRGPQKEE